jgi:hypothetical protein
VKKGKMFLNDAGRLAGLFQQDKSVISRHIKNLIGEGALGRDATVAKFATA